MRERKAKLEHEVMTWAFQIPGSTATHDAEYLKGLQSAISTATEYGIQRIEEGDSTPATIPPRLLAQARLAARSQVKVETVLRRYFNGYRVFSKVLAEVADYCGCDGLGLQDTVADLDRMFDALLAGVSAEYEREKIGRLGGVQGIRLQRVQSLLDGEMADRRDLEYPFEGHHLAVVTAGPDIEERLQRTAAALDRALLVVRIGEEETWAWLGGRRSFSFEEIDSLLREAWPKGTAGAFGEPTKGMDGWRLSHEQARAAISVARQGSVVRYAWVALVIAAQKDPLLSRSLREIFIVPFEGGRDRGKVYKAILRAYIDKRHNVSAAAATAGVSRRTVNNYLRITEEKLGPIAALASALDVALRLDEMSGQGNGTVGVVRG